MSIKLDLWKLRKKELKLTNKQIAELANLPLRTVEQIMCGTVKSPRLDTVEAIERALGLNEKSPNSINNTFSDEEQTIIKMYRSLPEKLKQLVYDQLVIYCEHKP